MNISELHQAKIQELYDANKDICSQPTLRKAIATYNKKYKHLIPDLNHYGPGIMSIETRWKTYQNAKPTSTL